MPHLCACCHGNDVETRTSGQSRRAAGQQTMQVEQPAKKKPKKSAPKSPKAAAICQDCNEPAQLGNYGSAAPTVTTASSSVAWSLD
jgi:hypothetical protein